MIRPAPIAALLLATATLAGEPPCSCDSREEIGVWCEAHDVGHVAGVAIESYELFETLDAHGHVIPDAAIDCDVCRKAKASTGYCEEHHMGWVGGLAYLSRLTYHLAQGRNREAAEIACPICRAHAASDGWCETCGVGRFGHVEIDDRRDFDALSDAYRILLRAIEKSRECELCAASMVIGSGGCPVHRTEYRDGKPVEPSPPPAD